MRAQSVNLSIDGMAEYCGSTLDRLDAPWWGFCNTVSDNDCYVLIETMSKIKEFRDKYK